MRITIEPTGAAADSVNYHKVIIEKPGNDHTIEEMFGLIRYCMLALGYHPKIIDQYIDI